MFTNDEAHPSCKHTSIFTHRSLGPQRDGYRNASIFLSFLNLVYRFLPLFRLLAIVAIRKNKIAQSVTFWQSNFVDTQFCTNDLIRKNDLNDHSCTSKIMIALLASICSCITYINLILALHALIHSLHIIGMILRF